MAIQPPPAASGPFFAGQPNPGERTSGCHAFFGANRAQTPVRIPGTTSGVPVSCRTKCRGKPPRARWAFDLTVPTSVSDENCGGGDGRAMNPNVQAPDLAVDTGAVHIRPYANV